MNQIPQSIRTVSALFALCLSVLTALGQPVGQWDFNSGNLSATVGTALVENGPGTQFGTTTSFGIPNIGGQPANVMLYPAAADAGSGYQATFTGTPNGGGTLINEWTLIMDVLYPAASSGKLRALADTDVGQINADSELFIRADNKLGTATVGLGNALQTNTWYRIGIVAAITSGTAGELRFYLDGAHAGTVAVAGMQDGRYALGSSVGLFTDNDGGTQPGYVNSIQLRGVALSKGQMLALGGATAAGIPQALPPVPSFIEKWIPAGTFASRSTPVGAVIDAGSTTIQDSSISLTLDTQAQANPVITRANNLITVQKDAGALPIGEHTLIVRLTDSVSGARSFTNKFTAALFYEDFEGIKLDLRREEGNTVSEPLQWTNRPPAGWTIDNSQFKAVVITADNPDADGDGFADLDGRSDWAGWTFANKGFWIASDNQTRDQFALGQGTLAIADNDEWDDSTHVKGFFNSFLKTPPISLAGVGANSASLTFASSWRPEALDDVSAADSPTGFPGGPNNEAINNQTAIITASFNGGTPVQILKWDSIASSPTFHPDSQSEEVRLPLNNPASATNVVLSFEMREAANDWWWAIDNVVVNASTGGASPPTITQQPATTEVNEGQPASLTATASGTGNSYQWFRGQGTGKTAVAGATSTNLSFSSATVANAGYYSLVASNSGGTATSSTARLTVIPKTEGRLVLLEENFNGLALGPSVDVGTGGAGGAPGTNVWTKTPPTGWSIDDTGVPGVGDPSQDGVTEWAGWSFAAPSFWVQDGGQNRAQFTKGTGAIAIADSDEWDDIGHAAGNMATYLKTKTISLAGVKAGSVIVKFDSSWRAEEPQRASVTVTFGSGTPVEILRFESAPASASFHPDETNETIAIPVNNPAGAQNMVITFGYFETRNNWWWAFDNLQVLGDPAPIFFEDFNSLALGPNIEEGIITGTGFPAPRTNVWTKTGPTGWTIDDTGVPGVGTPQDGVTEWAGWSFADRAWWAATAGDQNRTRFTKGTGASAIADSDEWDDVTHAAGNMATYLTTPAINIAGRGANTLVLKFDSSWRAEDPQKVNVRVSYDGGAPIEVMRWESSGALLHADNENESVTVALNNPAGATSMKITFGYFDTRNNWWWAIDNVEVSASSAPPVSPASLRIASITATGNNTTFTWTGGTAPFLVQLKRSLADTNWTDLLTTTERTATVPLVGGSGFFRIQDGTTKTVKLFKAALNGANEKPNAVNTPATGVGLLALDGTTATYVVSYSGLTANSTAAHVHGPADTNTAAGVMFAIDGPLGSTAGVFAGTRTGLTAAQVADIEGGRTYFNIHTVQNGGGEIRGQVLP